MTEMRELNRWSGYRERGSVSPSPRLIAATLWRLDQDAPVELDIAVPAESHIVCVHLDGHIDWSARYEDRRYRSAAPAGTLNLGRAGSNARIVYRNAHATFVHFYLPSTIFDDYLDDRSLPAARFELIDPANSYDSEIHAIGRRAALEMFDGPASRLRLDAAGLILGARLVERWSNLAGTSRIRRLPIAGGLTDRKLRVVTERMLDDLATEPSLGELASLAGLSREHFCRAFRTSTGMSPHKWLLEQRMAKACEMLTVTADPILRIAAHLGYDDPSYFARLFKKSTGLSPVTFRRIVSQ